MGKNQSASNLTNIIKQDASGNISFVSGSTTLMSVSSSGAITTTGNVAGTASYASNADLLDGLDSTVFTLTSSFTAQTASFTAFTASQNITNGTFTLTSSFTAQTASFTAFSSSVNSFSASVLSYTSSLNAKTSSFATTGSNTFIGTQVVSGSVLQSGSFTSTGTLTAQTLVIQTITSSVVYSSGSNIFGNDVANSQTFTGSVSITGSLSLNNVAIPTSASLASTYLQLAGGTLTGALSGTSATFSGNVNFQSTQPLTFTGASQSGTYNQTAIYINQNSVSGNTANGIFIERGRLTDAGGAEVRYFIIGARGGQIQWQCDGVGNTIQTGALSGTSATFSGTITSTANQVLTTSGLTTAIGYAQFVNTGGTSYFGIENSTGGGFGFTGATAYSTIIGNIQSRSVQIATNSVVRLTIDSTGAATFSSSVDATVANLSSGLKVTGSSLTTGTGAEIVFSSGKGLFLTFNRGTSTYLPTEIDGSTVTLSISGTPKLTIASTGAATFSSSVKSNSATTAASLGQPAFMGTGEFMSTGNSAGFFMENRSGGVTSTTNWAGWYYSGTTIRMYNGSADIFSMVASSGAATFSSSVTATGGINGYSGLNGYAGVTHNFFVDWSAESQITTLTATNLFFGTNAQRRMTITSGGEVAIGRTDAGGGRLGIRSGGNTSAANAIYIDNSSSTQLFSVRNDGYMNIGAGASSPYNDTTATAANLVVNSSGSLLRSTSSLKYKTDVRDYDKGLAKVLQMRPVYYKGKKDGETQFAGLIAEEVHELGLTEFVQYAEDGSPDALAYANMIALLTKAIQELNTKLDAANVEIEALKAR